VTARITKIISERMYKSRLHSWGLDKKKKEHEMLDLVRQGLHQNGEDRDKVFMIRGKSVTLADALHYFNRKGIKDPASLLDQHVETSIDLSSPDDADVPTPLSMSGDPLDPTARGDSDYEMGGGYLPRPVKAITSFPLQVKVCDFAERQLNSLQSALGMREIRPMPAFRTLSVESVIPQMLNSPEELRYLETIFSQTQEHYRAIFTSRNLSISNTAWTATSDDAEVDRFYVSMYHGYSFLWNGQREKAFENFFAASDMIQGLIKDRHVAFLIYILDLVIRHDGTGYEQPLMMILKHVADMAKTIYNSESEPIYLISTWLQDAPMSKSWLAESTLRKLLDFFQDSIGYFHPETIALLQTFATALLNRQKYPESAVRFQQLVDAFETTQGKNCYEVCYALRSTSEAYFHMEEYDQSLQALKAALERSESLPRPEEREIYVRCLRAMAEISNKLGRTEEAIETMQHVVDKTQEAFGADHPFSHRAKMHLKTIQNGDVALDSAIPPMVYRLGRGGSAAKYVWVSRSSPTRLGP
jgi:tetratricopeptide (TPR) repeat protein